jgi:hypothetical protein
MKRDADGRLTRFEYRGKYLRASRTGGVSLRAQGKAAGLNFTVNTKHGTRVSTRVAKGTNVGFQNGRFVLRGRYGKGPTKLNLSKSGLSVSSKTSVGTINWFKPRYSSAKIAGIQVRGKNAVYIHAVVALCQVAFIFAMAVAQLAVWIAQALHWIFVGGFQKVRQVRVERKRKMVNTLEANWEEQWRNQSLENLFCAQFYVLLILGKGSSEISPGFIQHSLKDAKGLGELQIFLSSISENCEQETMSLIQSSLTGDDLSPLLTMKSLFGTIVNIYRDKVEVNSLIQTFWALDHAVLSGGERNELQEQLLCVFADICGLDADS